MTLGTILVLLLVAGILCWLINAAPFIAAPFKQWAIYLVIAVVLIYIVAGIFGGFGQVTNLKVGG